MNTVSIQNLSHRYGKTLALDDVSLDIPKGATVGLIGPDGVGKSTLLSLMAGVKVIQDGRVEVLGGDMADKDVRRDLSHRIAFMPQGLGRNLYPTLSVYENIDFHARLFGLDGQERTRQIARLMEATRLAPFADRAAGKLSGGMKQKLSLCCALARTGAQNRSAICTSWRRKNSTCRSARSYLLGTISPLTWVGQFAAECRLVGSDRKMAI